MWIWKVGETIFHVCEVPTYSPRIIDIRRTRNRDVFTAFDYVYRAINSSSSSSLKYSFEVDHLLRLLWRKQEEYLYCGNW